MASALDIIQVIADMSLLGSTVMNVYDFVATDNTSDDDLKTDLANFIEDSMAAVALRLANDLAYNSLAFFNVTAQSDMGFEPWPTFTLGPVTATEVLPPGIAGLATLPTAKPKTRGRKFIPGFAEGYSQEGFWTDATVLDIVDYASNLISPVVGALTGSPIAYGVVDLLDAFWPCQAYDVTNVPSYQRRRKQGVGM